MRFYQTSNGEPEEGTIFLQEKWSDAARAAAAAGRHARAGGRKDWRKASRSTYAATATGAKSIGRTARSLADQYTIHRGLDRPKQADRVKRRAKTKLSRFGDIGQRFYQQQFA